MITCEHCGTQMLEGSANCPGCGAVVNAQPEIDATRPQSAVSDATASDTAAARANVNNAGATSTSGGMSAMTKALIAVIVALVAAGALIFWQVRNARAHNSDMTAEEMSLIVEGGAPQMRAALAKDPEERKKMAKDIRELLAVAEEARSKGYADRPEMKRQLDVMKTFVVAQNYAKKQRDAGTSAKELFTKDEVDAFLKEPGKQEQFDQFMKDLQKLENAPESEMEDAQKQQMQQQWATFNVLGSKGLAAGIDKDKATQVQIRLQQSRLLAQAYIEDLSKNLEPNEQEISAYFAQHPEEDPKVARQKAEDVLKRARAGEDFTALAKEFSEEPGAKEKGGELPWFGHGQMVKPFEDKAFTLKDGEISDIVETQFGYHIIKVTGHRTVPKTPAPTPGAEESAKDAPKSGETEDQIKAQHILFRTGGANANPMAPPTSPNDAAKAAILKDKREKLIEEIVARTKVKVPDDFPVKAPETPAQIPSFGDPSGGAGGPGAGMPPPDDAAPNAPDNGVKPAKPGTATKPAPATPKKK